MIDEIDRQILEILQRNARTSNAEIARQIDMAPSAVLERIRRLEAKGVIQGYETRINPDALGLGLLAFVFVRSLDFEKERELLAQIPGVQEVHQIAGEDCFLLKVRTPDAKALGRLLRERFAAHSTRTTVVLETVHESAHLPLEARRETAEEALHD